VKKLYDQKDYKKVIEVSQSLPKNSPRYAEVAKYGALAENELKKTESVENVKRPEATVNSKGNKELVNTEFNAGVGFFKRQEFDRAEERFTAVLQMDGNNSKAKEYLDKIRTMRDKVAVASRPGTNATSTEAPVVPEKTAAQKELDAVFNEGVDLFNKGKMEKARSRFQQVRQRDASYPNAESYLGKVTRIQETTKSGITAFFEGQYTQSIDQLAEASKSNTDNANVYAFLACSYAAKYFLTGGEDKDLYQNALNTFNRLKEVNAGYKLDSKYVSPKIIAILNGR
jgi:tetratricopeptide (TPR) repeat protein